MEHKYVLQLTVVTPVVASLSEDYHDFRVFRKGKFDIVLYKSDEEYNKREIQRAMDMGWLNSDAPSSYDYQTLKEYLLKQKFAKVSFLFPRSYSDPHKISFIKVFSNPAFYMLKKIYSVSPNIISILPREVYLGIYSSYVSKTRTPLVHETFEEGTTIDIIFLSDKKLDKKQIDAPRYARMGYRRNRGFGVVKLQIQKYGD